MTHHNSANSTWICSPCAKSYRNPSDLKTFDCPLCSQPCIRTPFNVAIPSPKNKKKWKAFCDEYTDRPCTKEYYAEILDATLRPKMAKKIKK
jgi:hypothetical protein